MAQLALCGLSRCSCFGGYGDTECPPPPPPPPPPSSPPPSPPPPTAEKERERSGVQQWLLCDRRWACNRDRERREENLK
ncbi:hypothetical protein M0804_008030 [Polistes exclamans]|nr:hypothetical protein M0804_008030 [Polistes exclamans]